MIGQTLSHFRITAKLGEGGMGEVYRAEDTTLDRDVALKILPPELAGSRERLERFQREAKTLAALDHPNIVTIHSVEEAEGAHFLTMQLVEGKRLSELIPKAGMRLEEIFDLAVPLADALAAAHEKGIIHRDLKPGNIMVTNDGRLKVLDFGLAKLRYGPDEAIGTQLPTEPLTDEGRVLGTVPYMSPEQVEGKPLDHRSDLFSLGVILYEMATGLRPFQGDSPASVMSAILRDTPSSVTDLKDVLPRQLARIIRRCLVKEPERRFQTARELAIELEELCSEVASGEAWGLAAPPPRRRRAVLWGGLGAAVVVLIAALAVVLGVLPSDKEAVEEGFVPSTATFTKIVFDESQKGKVSASPDGRFFVYASDASGNWDIYLRRIGGGKAINLTQDSLEDDSQPAFSADGESIAFRSERLGGGLFVMGATGESVRRISDHGYFPDWSPDGTKLVYSTSPRVGRWGGDIDQRSWIVDLAGGETKQLVDSSALSPTWSPNGWRIAFWGEWRLPETEATQRDLFTIPAGGGVPIAVTDDVHLEHSPAWSPDGRSLYYVSVRGGSPDLWRVSIDEETGKAVGTPEPMTSGSSVQHASPSGDGSRILLSGGTWSAEVVRVSFDPVAERVTAPPVSITPPALRAMNPKVSADGEWIAFNAPFGHVGTFAIGVVRKDGSELRQVTDSGHRDLHPDWSPDGQRLAFYSNRSGSPFQGWVVNADGGGIRLLTDTLGVGVWLMRWSPDGSQLTLCNVEDRKGKAAFVSGTVKPWSEEPPTQLPAFGDEAGAFCPTSWSPDGKRLAGDGGRVGVDRSWLEHRVVTYSLDSRGFETLVESHVTGTKDANPQWLEDGRRLFFRSEDGVFSILDTETGEQREVLWSESLGMRQGRINRGTISPDNRAIYFSRIYSESSISMLTLEEQE